MTFLVFDDVSVNFESKFVAQCYIKHIKNELKHTRKKKNIMSKG